MDIKKAEKRINRRRSGFTLIEILLVVVIIGILAGIGIPAISGKSEKAKIAQAKANITAVSSALAIYEMNNGTYPSGLDGLLDSSKDGYPFLDKRTVPMDPWGKPFNYQNPGANNTHKFDLSCTTPKGIVVNNWE
ncbi:MAG: type II secretion system protein GspG [Verrucomicrobiota bacterium]